MGNDHFPQAKLSFESSLLETGTVQRLGGWGGTFKLEVAAVAVGVVLND